MDKGTIDEAALVMLIETIGRSLSNTLAVRSRRK